MLVGGLVAFTAVLLGHAWVGDDAYITLRTVRNFVEGHGLRWNLHERVQSYTHPLWLFVLSIAYFLFRSAYAAVMVPSLALAVGAVWLVCQRICRSPAAGLLALAVLISSKSFMDYCTSGLENPLSYFLYVLFFRSVFRSVLGNSTLVSPTLLAGLLAVNRLDTILLCLPALTVRYWDLRRERRQLALGLLGFLPLVAWELFSVVYYGFPFPNTAYAKLGTGVPAGEVMSQGVAYYVSQLSHDPISLGAIAMAIASVFVLRERRFYPLLAGIVVYLVYIVKIGGDFMAGRFFSLPVLGAAILLGLCLPRLMNAATLSGSLPGMRALLPAAIVAAIGVLITPRPTLTSTRDYNVVVQPPRPILGVIDPKAVAAPEIWDARGVADERAVFYPSSGLLRWTRGTWPPHDYRLKVASELAPGVPSLRGIIGVAGFAAPIDAIIVDGYGLTDPLLARLPVQAQADWRIGHFWRKPPDGYLPTLQQRKNLITNPGVAEFYDHLAVVVSGPIFRWERWKKIVSFNFGRYDRLVPAPP